MFTGIIEDLGIVKEISKNSLTISTKLNEIKKGDSISVNGVCLTITEIKNAGNQKNLKIKSFTADISEETFNKTNLGSLKINEKVNLERAIKLDNRFSGHIVTGHIDTTTKIKSIKKEMFEFSCPEEFIKYVIPKGSVAIDGISLTVANVFEKSFNVAIIPFTLKNTNLQFKKEGDSINIEFDIISKYLENLLNTREKKEITFDSLKKAGFL
ncbi:MAG: riboflavin synthase [Endomicrobiia bacterium]